MKSMVVASFLLCLIVTVSQGSEYQVALNAQITGAHNYYDVNDIPTYTLFPLIKVRKDGVLTDAFASLASPSAAFEGYHNHPESTNASSQVQATSDAVVSKANGRWRMVMEEGSQRFEYEVDMAFSLPFAELPYFSSTTLVNGHVAGTFDWKLEGGSSAYPGPSSQIRTTLAESDGTPLASATLPITATNWTPNVDYSAAQDIIGRITTSNAALDSSSWSVTGVRAVTPAAPLLTFDQPTVQYMARRSASLAPPVPEPGSLWLTATGALIAFAVRRHSILR